MAPPDFELRQMLTGRSHAAALDEIMAGAEAELVLILDIDCVPLTRAAIPALAAKAAGGALAGCVQRANHIDNGAHLYVGAFCMAFSRALWERLGRPSFEPTPRGDVGEALTYACEDAGAPLALLWPSHVEAPQLGPDRWAPLRRQHRVRRRLPAQLQHPLARVSAALRGPLPRHPGEPEAQCGRSAGRPFSASHQSARPLTTRASPPLDRAAPS